MTELDIIVVLSVDQIRGTTETEENGCNDWFIDIYKPIIPSCNIQ